MSEKIFEIKKDNVGFGMLVERDAGSITLDDVRNIPARDELRKMTSGEPGIEIVDRLKVFAVFQKFGIENANGRIYPEGVLRRQVDLYQKKIDERWSYGELNHPESVTIDGDRIGFLITKLWWEKSTLVGEMELILSPGFVKYGVISCVGDKIANYLRLGLKIGVSSRGLGSVVQDKYTGKYIVQDDFDLTCWDVVTEASTPMAYMTLNKSAMQPWIESKQNDKSKMIEGIDRFLNKKILI